MKGHGENKMQLVLKENIGCMRVREYKVKGELI